MSARYYVLAKKGCFSRVKTLRITVPDTVQYIMIYLQAKVWRVVPCCARVKLDLGKVRK